ncbi:transcriptional regulator, AraC family [Peptoniphilus duerdenii ATCC BAA-1640]|uniref:Transcriptional regulator, AraC family n=1 Tax=Peptoniphilus duerdenii ATCC BAA-1640 TaxID=862517 RepID=E0NLN0_9FIRM|nr:AraC family transcriptional regulator [Peptoniphilus duerdenii]EFM25221.1 transcriptional regulator, AraC family [Peptoniphilus duerdenii ATCC BAA-1640]
MNKNRKIEIQKTFNRQDKEGDIISFDVEVDYTKTTPLLHKESRFLYILEGEGKIKVLDREFDLRPGVIIALLPWQISEIVEITKPLSYYLLVYSFEVLNEVIKKTLNVSNENIDMISLLYNNNFVVPNEIELKKMRTIFEDIRDEVGIRSMVVSEQAEYSSIYMISKLAELIVLYLRNIPEKKHEHKDYSPLPSEEIFQYMYLNSKRKITLEEMSKIFCMSESSISRYIYSLTGLGFYDLLQEMKLNKVIYFLLYTDLTLDEIADILNYTDAAHLSRVFKDQKGIGTKKFKDSYQNINNITHIKHDENTGNMVKYIYKNYAKNLHIGNISKMFDLTPPAINEALSYLVEMNFSNFLNNLRIKRAAELLIETEKPIIEIALEVGYNSSKTFSRNFIKFMKVNPGEFRNLESLK